MRFRNPTPRHWSDIGSFLFMTIFLPIAIVFDIFVVLPAIHERYGFLYNITLAIAIFIVFNIFGNMLACMIIDNSVKATDSSFGDCDQDYMEWRYCKVCKFMAPPRSWHCKWCRVCILKRDHHCGFSASCIGHLNHRNFLCFVLYMFVGSIYTFVYNIVYTFWFDKGALQCWIDISKTLFPVAVPSCNWWVNFQVFIIFLNIFAVAASSCALFSQILLVSSGQVSAKRAHKPKYNRGVYNNFRAVLGNRMYLVWMCPFIKSQLPDDGYLWDEIPEEGFKSTKHLK